MPHQKFKKKLAARTEYSNTIFFKNDSIEDEVDVAQLDLINDLDEDFFGTSYELVQRLVPLNTFVAGKMKRYVDILARIHAHYVNEVEASKQTREKVREADRKLSLALETSQASQALMDKLRESTAEAWRTADAAQYREGLHQNQVDPMIKDTNSKATDLNDSQNPKDAFLRRVVFRERDRLARELKEYQKRMEINRLYAFSLESIVEEQRETLKNQQTRITHMETDLFNMEHKCRLNVEHLEAKVIAQRKQLNHLHQVKLDLNVTEKKLHEALAHSDILKQTIDRLSSDNRIQLLNLRRVSDDNSQHKELLKNVETARKSVMHENDALAREIQRNSIAMKKRARLYALLDRRFDQLSKKNAELADREMHLNNKVTVLEKKLEIAAAHHADTIRQKEETERSRKKLIVELATQNDTSAALRFDLVIQRNRTQDVQLDLTRAHKSLDDNVILIRKVTREKNDQQAEITELNKTVESLERKVDRRTDKIKSMQDKMNQRHLEYLNIKKQMGVLHGAKTMLEKSLVMCKCDRHRLENSNGELSFQINQLCSQLASNEKEMITLQNRIDQLENLVKYKLIELHGKDQQLRRMRSDFTEMKIHNAKLQHTIEDDNRRFQEAFKNLETANKEKSLVGQQIVRRNNEVSALREKLTMMQLAINRGTMQYNQRVEDIRLLKTEIGNLRMSNNCMERVITDTCHMRQEVVRLERQLLRERLHVAAFTEEMKYPYRIHRWRVLIGKDPCRYQLIRKVQLLLKRNTMLAMQRGNLEHKVQDIQRLYDKLKQQLLHLPDPSVVERLWLQRRINQRQSRKLRAMQAELAINDIDMKSRDLIIKEYQQAISKDCPKERQPSKIVDKLFNIISIRPDADQLFYKSTLFGSEHSLRGCE